MNKFEEKVDNGKFTKEIFLHNASDKMCFFIFDTDQTTSSIALTFNQAKELAKEILEMCEEK